MATLDELLAQLPVDQIKAQLGVDRDTAEHASRAAVAAREGDGGQRRRRGRR